MVMETDVRRKEHAASEWRNVDVSEWKAFVTGAIAWQRCGLNIRVRLTHGGSIAQETIIGGMSMVPERRQAEFQRVVKQLAASFRASGVYGINEEEAMMEPPAIKNRKSAQ